MVYSQELRDAILRRILPPNNESIAKVAREEGIGEQTIRNWQAKARKEGMAAPGKDAVPDDWSTQDKREIYFPKKKGCLCILNLNIRHYFLLLFYTSRMNLSLIYLNHQFHHHTSLHRQSHNV